MTILILTCDLCGADAGDDPYHATMNGNGHVHICKKCFDQHQHDVGVLKQQRDELLKALLDERDALAAEVDRLAEALRGWWEAHRPVGWTEDQHRSCPHVNLATDAEKALATVLLRDQEEGK